MKRSLRVVVLAVLALLLIGPIPNSMAQNSMARPPGPRVPAARSTVPKVVDVPAGVSAAYGTGTIVHADALRAGEHALVDLDVAFSGAAFSSAGAPSDYTNEVHRLVAPKLDVNGAFSRGTGLELGLGSDPVPLIGQLSQASAPPSTDLVHRVIGPIGVPRVLEAELLRSQARARSATDACVLGPDQAYGLGSVLNLNVLSGLLSTVARPPLREVSQSTSTTRIVPGSTPGRLGLKSETRQTVAPVTFFAGSPFQFTIEVLGEWALQAVADGANGSIHYGPLNASPETPIARILDGKGKVLGQLTTQMLLGSKGLEVTIPGVAEIVIGEDPRMIGGDASSAAVAEPTQAVAAVDVVRVKLLNGGLADVRIGHMEAAVTVPAGGVQCPGLKVDQNVDKPTVTPGDDFVYTIDVTNPNDCLLRDLKVIDKPTLPPGVKIQVVATTPPGGQSNPAVLTGAVDALATYPDIGPLGPGEKKTIKIKVKVPLGSAAGLLKALGVAEGVCPPELPPGMDTGLPPAPNAPAADNIPVRGEDAVDGPNVGLCTVPDVKGLPLPAATNAIVKAGCILGDVKEGPLSKPADKGKVLDQAPTANTTVPLGTPVDVTIGGPVCDVPSVVGKTEGQAKGLLNAAGCDLGTVTNGPTGNPDDAGRITSQTPPAGEAVPTGTKVDVVVTPPACKVPSLAGKTETDAKALLEAAGCRLGTVTPGPDNPTQAGKIVDQGPTGGSLEPAGTAVNITVAGPVCNVPALIGLTEKEARDKVEPSGCVLVTNPKNTSNPAEIGKVLTQSPGADTLVARGSTVNVDLGVQVLGQSVERGPSSPAAAAAPNLVRTGGVALGGLALWLLFGGLLTRLAGSARLWSLARRRIG